MTDEKRVPDEQPVAEESGIHIPVVGIGASSGGLEVFKRLLGDLPGDTGFAIVFIQHLEANHPSMLAGILARSTSMPVCEAADGARVEANHVYVIPENVDLTLSGSALKLAPRTQTPGTHMPIDRFLRSLADQRGSRAIGVILSGAGSDGASGIEAIKAAGGVTFAQDAATAKVASMPQAAVDTGCVDFILPPEGIVSELVRIGRHPYIAGGASAQPGLGPEADEDKGKSFARIVDILHGATGVDFSLYREKMIKRRILRRLALNNSSSLAEYSERLENDSEELKALQRDLLIGVTSFFRDPESFEHLKKAVFLRIVQGRSANEIIRIWVAGCATGEEAYSIAIALQETLSETGAAYPVQIFASDISQASIEKARTGRYTMNIEADVSQERLDRYFTRIEGGYQINKSIREMCVFTRHNLIDDPPFSRLDLISCRNVLIYLGSVQRNIVSLFHYALKPVGFLLLGASEGSAASDLFSEVDREHRIYAKREVSRKPHLFPSSARSSRTVVPADSRKAVSPPGWDRVDVRQQVDRILLAKYSPAGVVLDQNLEVLEIRGKASPYLTLPAGKVSFNLAKLVPDTGLFLQIGELIQQAGKNGEPVRRENVPYEHAGRACGLNLEVVPLDFGPTRSTLVLFESIAVAPGADVTKPEATPKGETPGRHVLLLKQQLADAKERFLASLESQQASCEESQNATEEALSANEELQSLNEELETAKEELQSSNEELNTLNDELQAKNAALAQARDFAMSIVECVRQPLLVLDRELRIKTANKAFYRNFQLSPRDAVGQTVFSLSHSSWDLPGLRKSLESLLEGGDSFPEFEVSQDFPRLGRRNLVLGGRHLNHLDMILLAVDDITESKLAQQALRKSEDQLRQAQKMEAVGRLAGGIAHDFNNLLTAILGYSGLLYERLTGDETARHQVAEITKAGERAASLTKQLLAYSRRQVLQPKVIDLNTIVADFERMLRRLVGERIKVVIDCEPGLWKVRADPGEIGRAILNLSLNARDAMPQGGTLTIGTANMTRAEAATPDQDLEPGHYAMMIVHDTGLGIDAEMQTHIFEPFYTTKEMGKGTGLGLPTVLGIVEQSGGVIQCESKPGAGTAFKILLPAVAEPVDMAAPHVDQIGAAPKGSGVILLVEDEETVRKLSRMILEDCGYLVLDASNGREGLEVCKTHDGPIDLLVSDVVMPELGGRELAESALRLRPGMKVMFVSGHTEDTVLREGVRKGTAFLQKPFTTRELAQKVRETLEADAQPIGGAVMATK